MKKIYTIIYFFIVICLFAVKAYAMWCQTDWKCVTDCTTMGYQWGYCKSICSWCY